MKFIYSKTLFSGSFYCLTDLLTNAFRQAYLDNSYGYGLLFDVASTSQVPFGIPQYIKCTRHGLSVYHLSLLATHLSRCQ